MSRGTLTQKADLTRIAPAVVAAALAAFAPLRGHAGDPLHMDPSVKACSVRFAPNLTQEAFHRFAREFGSVSAFKQMSPPSGLGKGKVLIGVEMMSFPVDDRTAAWNDTFVHPDAGHWLGPTQSFPKFNLRA